MKDQVVFVRGNLTNNSAFSKCNLEETFKDNVVQLNETMGI
jgi:hypothetical protein